MFCKSLQATVHRGETKAEPSGPAYEKTELRVQGEQGGEHSQNTVTKEERNTQRKQSPEVCRGSSHLQYSTEYCLAQVCEETRQVWGPSEGFQAIVPSKQCLFPDARPENLIIHRVEYS